MILTVLFVGGLAIVAGAISFAHMRELATHHGQLGWKSYAFPISVDGLEIVASLYPVAQRRAGRHTGWIGRATPLRPRPARLIGRASPAGAAGPPGPTSHRRPGSSTVEVRSMAQLIPAARAARAALANAGRSLSRDNLADAMRDDGHGVSNARASLLLKILKAERDVISIDPSSGRSHSKDTDPLSEVVA
ncbi:DUF2637 domain-containing protein [Actinoplanes sp. NBRC 103695]|uniref:DUF2637 domain-containing protein n=1 Tax=Actinoplanes sp. NBRC 103695 TaxID=3032202 RepID=UPI0024A4D92A|nr:DUF2637 domain-containing protein [Actinoplanes sp. NBRC 103695]GLZ00671.1 hypothetical protein Acsp02_79230 [Actinoplanes sp. NBRC 103695]